MKNIKLTCSLTEAICTTNIHTIIYFRGLIKLRPLFIYQKGKLLHNF